MLLIYLLLSVQILKLLERESIEWTEEGTAGTISIVLDNIQRERLSFYRKKAGHKSPFWEVICDESSGLLTYLLVWSASWTRWTLYFHLRLLSEYWWKWSIDIGLWCLFWEAIHVKRGLHLRFNNYVLHMQEPFSTVQCVSTLFLDRLFFLPFLAFNRHLCL